MPLYGKIVIIKRNGLDGTTFPLMAQLCLFGRDPSCDIRVQLTNISKKHCAIVVGEDGKVSVNAYNRTLINGGEVNGRADISHKDIMTIADRSFRFEYPPSSIYRVQSTPAKPTSFYLLGPSLETPKDETISKPPASAGHTPRPKVLANSPNRKSAGGSPKLRTPKSSVSGVKKRKIIKSPQSEFTRRQSQRKNVSFGPYLSPEHFDLDMPADTPVKKGTTPRRVSEPPKYFGSPMVFSANRIDKSNKKQRFLVTTITEEEPQISPNARRKTMSPQSKKFSQESPRNTKTPLPKSKTPSPKAIQSPKSANKSKPPLPKIKTPFPKSKLSPKIPASPSAQLTIYSSVEDSSSYSDKLYLSSSDSSSPDTTMSARTKKNLATSSKFQAEVDYLVNSGQKRSPRRLSNGGAAKSPISVNKGSPIKKTTPQSAAAFPKKSPKPLPKIPTPKSPDSKKIKALAVIHASKLKSRMTKSSTKTPKFATSSLKKGVNKKIFSEVLKNGLAKKTPKDAKKLVKLAVARKKVPVKKTPAHGNTRSSQAKTPRHTNSPETIVISKKVTKTTTSIGKKKSLSVSTFATPSNISTDIFVSPLDATSSSRKSRNKGAMISRFIEDQANKNTKERTRKSGVGYVNPSGIKRLVKTPAKSPKSDYTNVAGIKRLFGSIPSADYSDVYGVEELMNSPEKSYERVSPVNALLYRSAGSPKPSTSSSSDIKNLLESSGDNLNEDEIAKLFGSPTSKPSSPKNISQQKLYPGSSNRRKSGRVPETFVRPIGIATQIRNSPTPTLKSPTTPKGRAKSITPKSSETKISPKRTNLVSPKTSEPKTKKRARSISAGRRSAARGLLDEIVTKVEDRVSPRLNMRNSSVVSPSKQNKTPTPKEKGFGSPSTSNANPLTESNAIPLTSENVIITQNSDPHEILEKVKVQESAKLVVLYLVSPETLSRVASQSKSPTGRSGRGVSPSPKTSPIKIGRRGNFVSSKETTSTPIQQFGTKATPTISPVAKDRSQGSSPSGKRPLIKDSPITTRGRPTRANKTKFLSLSKSERAIEDDLSSIKKSPSPVKRTRSSPAKPKSLTGGISSPKPSPKAKSPSPLKRVTRGRVQKREYSSKTPSPSKNTTQSSARGKKDTSINVSVASTSTTNMESPINVSTSAIKSPSPVKKGRKKAIASPKVKLALVKKSNRARGKSNNMTDDEISSIASPKSPSPVKKTRGKVASSPQPTLAKKATRGRGKTNDTTDCETLTIASPKSPSPVRKTRGKVASSLQPTLAKKTTRGRGKTNDTTVGEILSISSPRSPIKKTRGKASASPKPKSPSPVKKVSRELGKRKKSGSPSPQRSSDEVFSPPNVVTPKRSKRVAALSAEEKSPTPKRKAGTRNVNATSPSSSESKSPTPVKKGRGKRAAEEVHQSPKKAKTTRGRRTASNKSTNNDEAKKTTKKARAKKAPTKKANTLSKRAVKKKTGLSPIQEESVSNTLDKSVQKSPSKKKKPSPKPRRILRNRK